MLEYTERARKSGVCIFCRKEINWRYKFTARSPEDLQRKISEWRNEPVFHRACEEKNSGKTRYL